MARLLIPEGRHRLTGSFALRLFPLQTVPSSACGLLHAPVMIEMIYISGDLLVKSPFLLPQRSPVPAQSLTMRQPEAKDLSMFASIFDGQ